MIIKIKDIERWMGKSFANRIRKDHLRKPIRNGSDLLKCYTIIRQSDINAGSCLRRKIIKHKGGI